MAQCIQAVRHSHSQCCSSIIVITKLIVMFAVITPIATDDYLHLPLQRRLQHCFDGNCDIRWHHSVRVDIIHIMSVAVFVANRRNWTKPRHSGIDYDV